MTKKKEVVFISLEGIPGVFREHISPRVISNLSLKTPQA